MQMIPIKYQALLSWQNEKKKNRKKKKKQKKK